MSIQPGTAVPDIALKHLGEAGMTDIRTGELFKSGRSLLFGVPGAFTPTCSAKHLPGFVDQAGAFAACGVARIVCMAVNDAFVMRAWGKDAKAEDKVTMLADGNGAFSEAMGLATDASAYGMGTRCKRFAMVIEDGVVRHLEVEPPGGFRVSSAEHMLSWLTANTKPR